MKKLFTLLLIVCGMSTGAWALDQDNEGYYLLGSAQDWQDFATGINSGTIANTANARLTADNITASSMIGTNGRRYAGTFDGQGYAIVANITGTSGYEAPFSYIQNATIKKLTVSGTVNGAIHCSGLVGAAYGTINISNINITATVTTTGSHCGGIIGHGFSSNGDAISAASEQGSYIAMTRALSDAAIQADDVDYINAHATSTPQDDMLEAIALDNLFGGKKAYISSTKSMTGHECWMAGASEAVYSIIMMQSGFVAPNINLDNPDEYSARLNIARHRIDIDVNIVLSNSFGFGGTNSAIVMKKIK
ncbi:MAG: hypothetical protein J5630_00235 [Bacteroidaceae bacterium]|nr:hypothetical protein [Bacteroidaceae bacterium]